MTRPLAFIVVNYGSSALLEQNLVRSVSDASGAHVVVVDNFSTEGERARVRAMADAHGWTLVEEEQNLGFGGGVNSGVARALVEGATDLLLLNPDASIAGDAVRALQSAASHARRTVFAPRIVDGAGRTWFEGADVYLKDGRTMGVAKRGLRPSEERWEWLTGACLLIPDEAWVAAGGFDDDYFLYWEDVDFSRRVIESGGSLEVVADAVAVHDEGGTQRGAEVSRAKSAGYYYYNIRNRMLFATKHLNATGIARWRRGTSASALEILLRGGRRQFLHPWGPLTAGLRGWRDARRVSGSRKPCRCARRGKDSASADSVPPAR